MRNMIMEPVTRVREGEKKEGGGEERRRRRVPEREEKQEAGKDAKRAKEGKYCRKGGVEKLRGNKRRRRKTRREGT